MSETDDQHSDEPVAQNEALEQDQTDESATGQKEKTSSINRRTFVCSVGGLVVLGALGCLRFAGNKDLVRPPGGQDADTLLARCIHCGKCEEACPQQIIKLTHVEEGLTANRLPKLSFKENYCTWCEGQADAPRCVTVCPTDALVLEKGATINDHILGIAELDTETCLAYKDRRCRFCYDACPYGAMDLDEYGRPLVINDRCNGCGACESVCVSFENASISSATGDRAITVRPPSQATATQS